MKRHLTGFVLTAMMLACVIGYAEPIHTTYLWHLEQPIYWPDATSYGAGYETAWESIQRGGAHPENDVASIFSIDDRRAAYQYRPRDAIAAMTGNDAGAQVTYSGGLIRNVASLGEFSQLGYSPSWNNAFQTARNWTTSGGRPRLDMTIIPYHHSLAPLVDREVLKKDIQIYQSVYGSVWGSTPAQTTGFFPAELAFSERIIPVLAECGITWSFVPSNHVSRCCTNFPLVLGTGGENCDPPNKADQINPSSTHWFSLTIDRGCTPTDAVPFGFQPHYMEQVNPETGVPARVIAVPVAMAMSWEDGYQVYGIGDINSIAAYNDPSHPMLIVLGHDGDNAFGGGYSYYMESVPGFTSQAVGAGYEPSVVAEFLADHPPSLSDIIHVEDGAWVNADGDFGSPDFINWNWPLYDIGGQLDVENGWADDARNWAVITAATNRVQMAEDVAGSVNIAAIQNPRTTSASNADLAWHFLLGSLNSGYMYYGTSLDMEVKPSIACNEATDYADLVIAGQNDNTAPTVWTLQQFPHNPGDIGFGPTFGYQQVQNPRDFHVWTFAYDVSGVDACSLMYRLDLDGSNPLSSSQNETYAGGAEVTSWRARAMTYRDFPAGNVYNDGSINYFEMPNYIADQYFYHVTDAEITGEGGVLVDYYVKASDIFGNTKKTDIYHTWVGTGQGTGPGDDRVWMDPDTATGDESATIYYDAVGGPIAGAGQVYIHIGHSGWQGIVSPDPAMSWNTSEEAWTYTYSVPLGATAIDVVFNDGTTWDNNNGSDWHFPVAEGEPGPDSFVIDGNLDAGAEVAASTTITLWADWNGTDLYVATENPQGTGSDRFILVASTPGSMTASPWAKAGQVAGWSAFLAEEESNGWNGWFDNASTIANTAGTVLEGTINLLQEFGSDPESVWICLGAYGSSDGGALTAQAPAAVVSNGNIEASEWVELKLQPDSLIITVTGSTVNLNWSPVFGADAYRVYYRTESDGDIVDIFETNDTNYSLPLTYSVGFYEVRARF